MGKPFKEQLENVRGKIRRIWMWDPFKRFSGGLLYYLNKSNDLRAAALVLSERREINSDIFAMLAGQSLEVLLKGILKGLQDGYPKHHKLVDLWERTGIPLSDDERTLLEILTEYVTWAGKYPVALSPKAMTLGREILGKRYPRGGNAAMMLAANPVTVERYDVLWTRLHASFFEINSATFESADMGYGIDS